MTDDLISRQAAIDAVSSMFAPTPTQNDMVEDCLEIIEKLPSVQSEQKHGKWLNAEHAPNYLCYCTCSVCGKRQTIESANYCPNCGARMEE